MIVLLDENFPLGLLYRLQADGLSVDHIITLGWRGASDRQIQTRLQDDDVLFLTQDDDFLFGVTVTATIVVSRVRQSRPLKERIEVWRDCVHDILQRTRSERLFELMDDGTLRPWRGTTS